MVTEVKFTTGKCPGVVVQYQTVLFFHPRPFYLSNTTSLCVHSYPLLTRNVLEPRLLLLIIDDPRLLPLHLGRILLLHVLLRPQHRIAAHRDVAAGVGGVRQRVAVLAGRGGRRRGTPGQADHVAEAHALALLLATVVETLTLEGDVWNAFKESN